MPAPARPLHPELIRLKDTQSRADAFVSEQTPNRPLDPTIEPKDWMKFYMDVHHIAQKSIRNEAINITSLGGGGKGKNRQPVDLGIPGVPNFTWWVVLSVPQHPSYRGMGIPAKTVVTAANARDRAMKMAQREMVYQLKSHTEELFHGAYMQSRLSTKEMVERLAEVSLEINLDGNLKEIMRSQFDRWERDGVFKVTPSQIQALQQQTAAKGSDDAAEAGALDGAGGRGPGNRGGGRRGDRPGAGKTGAIDPSRDSMPMLPMAKIPVPPKLTDTLPVYEKYRELMFTFERNAVTIISAETGAGKTTQIPQYIVDHHIATNMSPAHVLVTQPRRLAATSIARRVAQERGVGCGRGSHVGYSVRFDHCRPTSTRQGSITFVTEGLLLRQLTENPTLDGITHIILDEVHERELSMDLLLILLRRLRLQRPDIRLILMSATAETTLFQDYFDKNAEPIATVGLAHSSHSSSSSHVTGFPATTTRRYEPPSRSAAATASRVQTPIVSIGGRCFPVKQYTLENTLEILNVSPIRRRYSPATQKALELELSYQPGHRSDLHGQNVIMADLIEHTLSHIVTTSTVGAILVFLPGLADIQEVRKALMNSNGPGPRWSDPSKFDIHMLHSSIPFSKQGHIFEPTPHGKRKIILSTNIAETSVTINDVVFVVDAGKVRQSTYDPESRISKLASVWASQSNVRQRMGRAGRCQPGESYLLMSRTRYANLPRSLLPELLRTDLASTALYIKTLSMEDGPRTDANQPSVIAQVFSEAPQPPQPSHVDQAILDLITLGALDHYQNLTPLGQLLTNIPTDPWLAKMILTGHLLQVDEDICIVAVAMEQGTGPWRIKPEQAEKELARQVILERFSDSAGCDFIAILNAYRAWKRAKSVTFTVTTTTPSSAPRRRGPPPSATANEDDDDSSVDDEVDEERVEMQPEKGASADILTPGRLLTTTTTKEREWTRHEEGVWCDDNCVSASIMQTMDKAQRHHLASVRGGSHLTDKTSGRLDDRTRYALIRSIVGSSLYPNVASLFSKDIYRSSDDQLLRLGGSTINGWRGLTFAAERAKEDSQSPFPVYPRPAPLLSFLKKQMVDRQMHLRQTTQVDALALVLLTTQEQIQLAPTLSGDEAYCFIADRRITMDRSTAEHILMMRRWWNQYLNWSVHHLLSRQTTGPQGSNAKAISDLDRAAQKSLVSLLCRIFKSASS